MARLSRPRSVGHWLAMGVCTDPMLDRFMPIYDIAERHHIRVDAPAELAFASACEADLAASPIVRAIFKARELITLDHRLLVRGRSALAASDRGDSRVVGVDRRFGGPRARRARWFDVVGGGVGLLGYLLVPARLTARASASAVRDL